MGRSGIGLTRGADGIDGIDGIDVRGDVGDGAGDGAGDGRGVVEHAAIAAIITARDSVRMVDPRGLGSRR
jgi:hypothetical protein